MITSETLQPVQSKRPCEYRRAQCAYETHQSLSSSVNWQLVEQYLPLLKSLVARMRIYFPDQIEYGDLYSIGMAGLIQAASRFDGQQPFAFAPYASCRIRGALLDELRRIDHMGRCQRSKTKALQIAIQEVEQKLGRPAQNTEVAAYLGISDEEYEKQLERARPLAFIDIQKNMSSDSAELTLAETLADPNQPDVRTQCEKKELMELIYNRIQQLQDMPKKVLILYYYKQLRLAEIAHVLGVTESRVSQIHAQAILGLKAYITTATL